MQYQPLRKQFAKKSLGQNFLVDHAIVGRIIHAFDPSAGDTVVEIGPGRGALTVRLVELAGMVYAIEFDRDLAESLNERFGGQSNFQLIQADALSYDFAELVRGDGRLRLIANLPYNISTAILQRLTEYTDVFLDCVLMFQREVVDRITAAPGNTDRGFLTVLTEASFAVERLFDVPPGAFRPVPKVWSSVVRLRPKGPLPVDQHRFRELIAAAFTQKRKTILNNLKATLPNAASHLEAAAIDPRRRAETLTLDEWVRLASLTA